MRLFYTLHFCNGEKTRTFQGDVYNLQLGLEINNDALRVCLITVKAPGILYGTSASNTIFY